MGKNILKFEGFRGIPQEYYNGEYSGNTTYVSTHDTVFFSQNPVLISHAVFYLGDFFFRLSHKDIFRIGPLRTFFENKTSDNRVFFFPDLIL